MIFSHKNTNISNTQLLSTMQSLTRYIDEVRNGVDHFPIHTVNDTSILDEVVQVAGKIDISQLKYVLVVGIGGSNLGTWAVYDALRGMYPQLYDGPQLIFVDTISPTLLTQTLQILDAQVSSKDEILVNVISKSGSTTETIANASIIFEYLQNRFGDVNDRFVTTTDKDSKLWNYAQEHEMQTLRIPEHVGGRFSVFSAVGLFPLHLAGGDVKELRNGAQSVDEYGFEISEKNYALVSACVHYLLHEAGHSIANHFFFAPELERVGKWYRQLMGESIGKKHDLKGDEVREGITPIISIGTTDLHSMAQLFYGGPKDKITTIVSVNTMNSDIAVPQASSLAILVDGVAGKSVTGLMNLTVEGVKNAYINNSLPFMEIELEKISEFEIGQLLQMKMFEMIYLAKLMNINAFDQPSVEDYKSEVRKILKP